MTKNAAKKSQDTNNKITLRPATEEDMSALNAWCYMNGMDNLPGVEGVTVAVRGGDGANDTNNADTASNASHANNATNTNTNTNKAKGTPVGFIRIVRGANGFAHVNPIVVDPDCQHQGIGKMLTHDALKKYGELRFVSRGSSVGFYEKLGATKISWSEVDLNVTDDCDGCPMRVECNPCPMKLKQTSTN